MLIDEEIIKAIKKNDRRTILQLYEYSFNKMMGLTVRYFKNEEEKMSVVNNSFIKIIDNISSFRVGTNYLAWIGRITYNEIINFISKEKKYKNFMNFDKYDTEITTLTDDGHVNNVEWIDEKEILELIHKLPSATRIVFDMYVIEGDVTYKEVSKTLKISIETVKWHLKVARKQLKEQINKRKEYEYRG